MEPSEYIEHVINTSKESASKEIDINERINNSDSGLVEIIQVITKSQAEYTDLMIDRVLNKLYEDGKLKL